MKINKLSRESYFLLVNYIIVISLLLSSIITIQSINESQIKQINLFLDSNLPSKVIKYDETKILQNHNIKSIDKKNFIFIPPPDIPKLIDESIYLIWEEADTNYFYETRLIGKYNETILTLFENKILLADLSVFKYYSRIKSHNEFDFIVLLIFMSIFLFITPIQANIYINCIRGFGEEAIIYKKIFYKTDHIYYAINALLVLFVFIIYSPIILNYTIIESQISLFSLSVLNSRLVPGPIFLMIILTPLFIYNFLSRRFIVGLKNEFNNLAFSKYDPAMNELEQKYDIDIIKIDILKNISRYTNPRKFSLGEILILLGYRIQTRFTKNKLNKLDTDLVIQNDLLINEINSLIKSGFLDIINNDFVLTRAGKEKVELPSILFLSNLPPKFDFELSRANKSLQNGDTEETIKILSVNILEAFTSWTISKLCDPPKLQSLVNKYVSSKNKSLENATLGQLVEMLKVLLEDLKKSIRIDHINKINYLLTACINILEAGKVYRNEYAHQRDITEYTQQNVIEDAYNLLQLSRMYMLLVCKHIIS